MKGWSQKDYAVRAGIPFGYGDVRVDDVSLTTY